MAFDIGPKIGIEGEAEFRAAIRDVNTSLKTLSTEMGTVTSAFGKNQQSEAALTAKNEVLNREIDKQKEKLDKLKQGLSASSEKYGENDEKTQKWQQAVNSAQTALNKMENELGDNKNALDKMKNGVDDTAESEKKAEKQTSTFGDMLKANLSSQAIIDGVHALANGIQQMAGKLKEAVTSTVEYGSKINDMSEKIGLSSESYQKWDYVMKLCGENVDSLKNGMKTLSTQAQKGSTAFQELGISQKDVATLSKEDLLTKTIEGLAGMEDGTKRTALATQLLGKSGADMGSLLNQGTGAIKDQMDMAEKYGLIMSDSAIKASDDFGDSIDTLKMTMDGAKNRMISEFFPSMTKVTDGLAQLFTGDKGGLSKIDAGIKQFINKVMSALPKVIEAGRKIVESLAGAIINNLPKLVDTAGKLVMELATDLIKALPKIVETAAQVIISLANGIAQNLPTLVPTIVDVVLKIVDTLIDNVDALVDAAIAIITALAEGLINALPKLIAKAPEIVEKLVQAIIRNGPKLAKAALEIVEELAKGIVTNLAKLVSPAEKAVAKVVSSIKGKMRDVVSVGHNIIEGLWNGMNDKIDWLIDKIKGFCKRSLNAIKDFFGIHSPSTVMAEQGDYLMQGLGLGIERSAGDVLGKLDIFNAGLLSKQTEAVGRISALAGYSFGTLTSGGNTQTQAQTNAISAALSSGVSAIADVLRVSQESTGTAVANITVNSVLDGQVIGRAATQFQLREAKAVGR